MGDEAWLADVAQRAGATSYEVSSHGRNATLSAQVPAPSQAKKFTGDYLQITLRFSWGELDDGGTDGTMAVDVAKMPVDASGTGHIEPLSENETEVSYDADFTVKIPLMGARLEKMAAPYVRQVLDVQHEAGLGYLR